MPQHANNLKITVEKSGSASSGQIVTLDDDHAIVGTQSGNQYVCVFSSAEKMAIKKLGAAFCVGKTVHFTTSHNSSVINLINIDEIYSPETTFSITRSPMNRTPDLTTSPAGNPRSVLSFMQSGIRISGERGILEHPLLETLSPKIKSPLSADQVIKRKKLRARGTPIMIDAEDKDTVAFAEVEPQPNSVNLPGTIESNDSDQTSEISPSVIALLDQLKSPRQTEKQVDAQKIPDISAAAKSDTLARRRPPITVQTKWAAPASISQNPSDKKFRVSGHPNSKLSETLTMHLKGLDSAQEERETKENMQNLPDAVANNASAAQIALHQELYNAIAAAIIANDNQHTDIKSVDTIASRNLFLIKKFRQLMDSPVLASEKLSLMIAEASHYAAEKIIESQNFCCFFSRKIALTPIEKLCKLIAGLDLSEQNPARALEFNNKLLETYLVAVTIQRAQI
jgi:hypothetical protein